jgi:hypothetical protein
MPNNKRYSHIGFDYKKRGRKIFKVIVPEPFIIKDRNDGGRDIYDEKTGRLRCVCNIEKRYEFYLPGEFKEYLSSATPHTDDIIIRLIPDKDRVWVTEITYIDPTQNIYLIKKRDNGGVDLYERETGKLKYICNIGKRFYYIPSAEREKLSNGFY